MARPRKAPKLYYEFPEVKDDYRPPEIIKAKAEEKEEELPTTVQGKAVDSLFEARIAVALGILQFPFIYQYTVFGGRDFRGGQIIDFLVLLPPLPTPLYAQSKFWHGPTRKGKEADAFAMGRVRQYMKGWNDPKEIWDYKCPDVNATIGELRRLFGSYG